MIRQEAEYRSRSGVKFDRRIGHGNLSLRERFREYVMNWLFPVFERLDPVKRFRQLGASESAVCVSTTVLAVPLLTVEQSVCV